MSSQCVGSQPIIGGRGANNVGAVVVDGALRIEAAFDGNKSRFQILNGSSCCRRFCVAGMGNAAEARPVAPMAVSRTANGTSGLAGDMAKE